MMYWEGVKVDYHWSEDERIIVGTIVEKTFVEYGSRRLRYSLTCNCTPDVAMNRVRNFEKEFKKRVGFEILQARIQENNDKNVHIFMGIVRKDNIVLDLPTFLTDSRLFETINNEIEYQLRYVDKKHGYYSYYDGRGTKFFESFEELLEAIGGGEHGTIREYFGEEYVQLFPGSRSYFRNYRKYTVYVVNDSTVMISGPGYTITAAPGVLSTPEKILRLSRKAVGNLPASLTIVGNRVVRGKYYEKRGKYYFERKIGEKNIGKFMLDLYEISKDYGARGGLIGENKSVIVFDDYIIVFMKKLGLVQRIQIKDPKLRLGTLYRYLYFAPQPRAKNYKLIDDLNILMYIASEGIENIY